VEGVEGPKVGSTMKGKNKFSKYNQQITNPITWIEFIKRFMSGKRGLRMFLSSNVAFFLAEVFFLIPQQHAFAQFVPI
jgi:hypothetical protein